VFNLSHSMSALRPDHMCTWTMVYLERSGPWCKDNKSVPILSAYLWHRV